MKPKDLKKFEMAYKEQQSWSLEIPPGWGSFNNHVAKKRGGGGLPNVHDCPR